MNQADEKNTSLLSEDQNEFDKLNESYR